MASFVLDPYDVGLLGALAKALPLEQQPEDIRDLAAEDVARRIALDNIATVRADHPDEYGANIPEGAGRPGVFLLDRHVVELAGASAKVFAAAMAGDPPMLRVHRRAAQGLAWCAEGQVHSGYGVARRVLRSAGELFNQNDERDGSTAIGAVVLDKGESELSSASRSALEKSILPAELVEARSAARREYRAAEEKADAQRRRNSPPFWEREDVVVTHKGRRVWVGEVNGPGRLQVAPEGVSNTIEVQTSTLRVQFNGSDMSWQEAIKVLEPEAPGVSLSLRFDPDEKYLRERLHVPASFNTAEEALDCYEQCWNRAVEMGGVVRGGTLTVDGEQYRVSQNGRVWSGEHAVSIEEIEDRRRGRSPAPAADQKIEGAKPAPAVSGDREVVECRDEFNVYAAWMAGKIASVTDGAFTLFTTEHDKSPELRVGGRADVLVISRLPAGNELTVVAGGECLLQAWAKNDANLRVTVDGCERANVHVMQRGSAAVEVRGDKETARGVVVKAEGQGHVALQTHGRSEAAIFARENAVVAAVVRDESAPQFRFRDDSQASIIADGRSMAVASFEDRSRVDVFESRGSSEPVVVMGGKSSGQIDVKDRARPVVRVGESTRLDMVTTNFADPEVSVSESGRVGVDMYDNSRVTLGAYGKGEVMLRAFSEHSGAKAQSYGESVVKVIGHSRNVELAKLREPWRNQQPEALEKVLESRGLKGVGAQSARQTPAPLDIDR